MPGAVKFHRVLRAPPVTLRDGGAQLTAEPRIDLSEGTLSVEGTLTYDAGPEAVVGADPEVRYAVSGPIGATEIAYDINPLVQFLTQRALEKEQARVEAMQAVLIERQRLRREVRYYAAFPDEVDDMLARQDAAAAREEEVSRRERTALG